MEKSEIAKQLLTLKDLAKRWKYGSVNGVRKRLKFDRSAPQPFVLLNSWIAVYWGPDIDEYENRRGTIDASLRGYQFYEEKAEWDLKSREQKEAQRGSKYSDEEWREIKQKRSSL